MRPWFEFFTLIGTAAATLMGLLFVSLSLNPAAALQKGPEGSRRHAEQAFENYLAVLMVALLSLIPDLAPQTYGRTLLAVTAIWSVFVLVRLYQAGAERSAIETRVTALRRHLSTLIGFGLLILGAATMALGRGEMKGSLAAASLVLLFSATEKSWGLLVRLAAAPRRDP
jgi:hypothetical protein